MIYSPQPAMLKRVRTSYTHKIHRQLFLLTQSTDWLRDRHMFDNIQYNQQYAETRLGFSAPNVFVMRLASY